MLSPGGILFLNTPCVDSASFGLLRQRHIHVSGFGHVSLFTKRSLAVLASRAGFRMLEHGYTGGLDVALCDVLGMAIAPQKYSHRSGFYSMRFIKGCTLLDNATFGMLKRLCTPRGNESYQWAIWQSSGAGHG